MNKFSLPLALVLLILTVVEDHTVSYTVLGPHIADVNLLLPPKMTLPVEYRLQGSGGCFKWLWDHHDILSVLPEYNSSSQCSTSARLKSIAPYTGRKETAVYATDVRTGIVIRCKVFIENISRIQIFHHSVKLDLDGLATLRVRAFDSEENVFSSLAGLQFMWQLMPEAEVLSHHLVNVPLKDSPLSDCGGLCGDLDIQISLEDSGVFSDLYVVKGVEIGHEVVSVQLLEPQLWHMSDKIVLTVAEAMSLDPPSPVFVLVGSVIPYTLKVVRANIPQVVALPSPHHRWSVSNSSVSEVDSGMGLAYALSLGMTSVIVEDTRVAGHMQISSLNVVLPDSISLYLTPLSSSGDVIGEMISSLSMARWYTISGRQYLIQIKVFALGPGAQDIYITENDDIKVYDNQSKYWKSFLVSNGVTLNNGWKNSRVLKAYSQGLGKLTAALTYSVVLHQTKEVLKVVQEIMVCDQVKFNLGENVESQIILLPWAPTVLQELELKATGGCAKVSSDYKWFSSDPSIVSVSAFGAVQARQPGNATIKVLSLYDSLNYDEVIIEVSLPTTMVMLQTFPVETVVGSYLQAAVTMKASNGDFFYKCDAFKDFVKWKAGSESFVVVNSTLEASLLDTQGDLVHLEPFSGPQCSRTNVYASAPGFTILHATFSKQHDSSDPSFRGPIDLKASSHIAAYPPLTIIQAGDGNEFGGYWFNVTETEADKLVDQLCTLYIVPGAQVDVLLLGGPERWDRGVNFVESVEVFDEDHSLVKDGVPVEQLSHTYRRLYRISCQKLGTFKLVFRCGNMFGDDHPLPAIAEASLLLVCNIPSSIVLLADEPVNQRAAIQAAIQAERGTGGLRDSPITVANGRTIRLSAVGISNSGEPLANSSSLDLLWDLSSSEGLAHWDDSYDTMKSNNWQRFLVLHNESGQSSTIELSTPQCIVRATVTNFVDTMGNTYLSHLLDLEYVLTDAVRLQIVSTLRIHPEFTLLYFSSELKVNLSITGGSCFLEAISNNSQVVDIVHPPPVLHCTQMILSPEGMGTALVTLLDTGLASPLKAFALVQVADIDWIKIVSGEEICLMEGNSQTIDLLAGVNGGGIFDSSQYAYMNIHVHVEDSIVELISGDKISTPVGGFVNAQSFKIKGVRIGITTLYVEALQHSGHLIQSQPIRVEVYEPPRINPPEVFLVPGASYVLTLQGGPTVGVYVEFISTEEGIAKIDKLSGRLTAISTGNATILATVLGNEDNHICEAYGSVRVRIPSTVALNVQSEQLSVGRELPIYPVLPEGNLFSFYELCKNYQWTIEDEKVFGFTVAENLYVEAYGSPSPDPAAIQFGDGQNLKGLSYIKLLNGRSAGRTNVAVSFSCDFMIPGPKILSRFYNASISLFVVPDLPLALGVPMTWIFPPHYTTESLLPSSSEAHAKRESQRRTISYSLLRSFGEKSDLAIVGDRIRTAESDDLACIQAKDHTTGRIDVAACVKVIEVAQIRVTSKKFQVRLIDLAVGAEEHIPISYFDALGNPFYEAHKSVQVHVETNYPDILHVNNTVGEQGSIYVKANRYGEALVRVSIDGTPQKSDYMLIRVGAHLHPQNPALRMGHSLNFTVKGLTENVNGKWFTTNDSVMSVDIMSGTAEAIGEGTAQVIFQCPSLNVQTTVNVIKENLISVHAPREVLTNVPYPTKGYYFYVKFSDTHVSKSEAFGNRKEVLFDCTVDPPFLGYAKPWLDLNTGNSYCLFFPYSPEHLVHSIESKLDGLRPDITLSIHASLRESKHVSGSASALFIGGFSMLETGKNSLQLNLTPDSNKTSITILGNTDVEIYWREKDSMSIACVHKEHYGIVGRARYEVEILKDKKFKDKIIITLPANGQRLELDVNFEPGESVAQGTSITLWASILVGVVMLAFTLVFFVWYMERPTISQRPNLPSAPNRVAPATPDRPSPSVVKELSPSTPQPFVDYVRRTIDETPYYRREGRRRINLQNTF